MEENSLEPLLFTINKTNLLDPFYFELSGSRKVSGYFQVLESYRVSRQSEIRVERNGWKGEGTRRGVGYVRSLLIW